MDDNRIRSVLIVGGGTAGWLTAAFLKRALADVRITVVESSAVPRIGVGEATIPSLRSTMEFIGVDEAEWMRACNATFKSGILFQGWRVGPSDPNDTFYHPFFPRPNPLLRPFGANHMQMPTEGISTVHCWMSRVAEGKKERYDYLASVIPRLCDEKRFGPALRAGEMDLRYGYHIDAARLAVFLRDLSKARGVAHVVDDVTDARLDAEGNIAGVQTKQHGELTADLFIDCTGFRSLLLGKAMGEPFLSDHGFLPCDSAVALQPPHDPERDEIRPYTIAEAMSAGWTWHIPLYHREGIGYVYSSRFQNADQAEHELRTSLGPRGRDVPANHIRMRVGRTRRLWVKNCIGIGLSAMFIEPLESTSIFMTEFQLSHLVSLFPDRTFPAAFQDRYNEMMTQVYEQIRDFIVMHYCTTQREDTAFWRAVKHELPIPESLRNKLESYKAGLSPTDYRGFHIFLDHNWAAVLSGMGIYPERGLPIVKHADAALVERHFADIDRLSRDLCARTPRHKEYIRSLHEAEASATA
jgi:tryptophan halogenase